MLPIGQYLELDQDIHFDNETNQIVTEECDIKEEFLENNVTTTALPKKLTIFTCEKCGREYRYKNFLQVHQKRKCGQF